MRSRPLAAFSTLAALVAVATLLSCCFPMKKREVSPVIIPGQRVVVVVPGYKGSELLDRQGATIWVSAYEALLGRKRLALSTPELPIRGALDLFPGGILKLVSLGPFYSYPVYEDWLSRLRETSGEDTAIYPFAYDWRRDIEETVALLSEEIRRLREAGAGSIVLAGHSMGALVAAYYIRYGASPIESAAESWEGADSIDAAILVVGPYQGSAVMFRDMQTGVRTALNTTLLDSFSLSSFPSSYQLLTPASEPILTRASEEPLSIHRADHWREKGWGLFRTGERDGLPSLDTTERFVARMLERSEKLSALVNSPGPGSEKRGLPVLNISGVGLPTPSAFVWPDEQRNARTETELFASSVSARTVNASGDGVVLATSSKIPAAYRAALETTEVEVTSDHLAILADEATVEAVRKFFATAIPRGR